MSARERYEIWEETNTVYPRWCWRAQLVNYVARFLSKEDAEAFVVDVKRARKEMKLT